MLLSINHRPSRPFDRSKTKEKRKNRKSFPPRWLPCLGLRKHWATKFQTRSALDNCQQLIMNILLNSIYGDLNYR